MIAAVIQYAFKATHQETRIRLQRQHMELFFGMMSEDEFQNVLKGRCLLEENSSVEDICSWYGVVCDDSIVIAVNWSRERGYGTNAVPYADPRWLPPTIQDLRIASFYIGNEWETRFWPRELRQCDAYDCDIFGSVDTLYFPQKLESVDLCGNYLTGKLVFGKLPNSLRTVNVQSNLLEVIVVIVDEIPVSVQKLSMDEKTLTTSIIRFVGDAEGDARFDIK